MIKRTPQEIADFFQCYVAMDKVGRWCLYKKEPYIEGNVWIGECVTTIGDSLIKDDKTIDWKDSLCVPRTIIDPTEDYAPMLGTLKKLIDSLIAEKNDMDMDSLIHKIADYYRVRDQMGELSVKCVELASAVNHWFRDCSVSWEQLVSDIADVELMLEQVKYLLKISQRELCEIKNDRIEIFLALIGDDSTNEEEEK